jgi:hypothetical protein
MNHKVMGQIFNAEESHKLVLARSLEWEAFPVFATRSIAPIFLFWFIWWQICLFLICCSFVWCPIRKQFASLRIAIIVAFLNNLYIELIANLIVAIIFFSTGRIANGFIALFWNFISTGLAFAYPPTKMPIIQEKFWEQLQEGEPLL